MTDKITLKDETAAIDLGARLLWDTFTEDQRKQISLFLLLRYASSIRTSNRDAQELAIFKTNEYYNKHFFSLSKHPKLLWYLVCMCGNDEEKIYFHEWIGFKKKNSDNKIFKFLEEMYPDKNDAEIELMIKKSTKAELKQYAKDLGLDDKEIKKIL